MKLRKDLLFIGDKTLWGLITLLFAFSLITVFSSTSLTEEVRSGGSRFDLFLKQALYAGFAFVAMVMSLPILDYMQRHRDHNVLMWLSRGMLWIAFITGFMLRFKILNDHRLPDRALNFGVLQYNVAEFFKFFLIFGLVGQIVRYRSGDTPWYYRLREWVLAKSGNNPIAVEIFKEGQCFASRFVVLYAPLLVCIGCIVHGSFSSSAFLVIIAYFVFCFGIERKPRLQLLGAVVILGALLMVFISAASYSTLNKLGGRFETMKARVEYFVNPNFDINTFDKNTQTYEDMVEYIRQIEGAKVGIQRGGVLGVGVGLSKQKYKVAAYFNDFLFSFVCEEYGLWGGILTVLLFMIIAMRGRYLSQYLDDPFDRILLNIFVLVVVLQAYMHIAVNLGVVPMTGQALPLLSSGNSALFTFTGIFAITIYLSHKALVAKERKEQEKLFEETPLENESDN